MNSITETLLFPYTRGLIERPKPDSRLLFLNAENPSLLKELTSPVLVQPRYDKARSLIEAGYKVIPARPEGKFDTAWILPGKDMTETQCLLAQTVISAKENGIILAAAPNDAGGKRLEGLFENLGLTPHAESKHKARVVYASIDKNCNKEQAGIWLAQGQEQFILNSDLVSCPGLHGWDKVDTGSALLARHLPADLRGSVADFGCGWGYLSLQAAATSKKITRLTLIDIDSRAIYLAEKNVRNKHPSLTVEALWADLASPDKRLGKYDVILMNPPFHEGTHAVPALGQALITTAAHALKPSGSLYMVANRHLPYEKTLQALFSRINPLADENGFKAFDCKL